MMMMIMAINVCQSLHNDQVPMDKWWQWHWWWWWWVGQSRHDNDQVALDDLTAAQEAANRAHEAAAAALANVNQVSLVIVIIVSIAFIAIIAISLLLTYIIINDSVIITPSVSCPHVSQNIDRLYLGCPVETFSCLIGWPASPERDLWFWGLCNVRPRATGGGGNPASSRTGSMAAEDYYNAVINLGAKNRKQRQAFSDKHRIHCLQVQAKLSLLSEGGPTHSRLDLNIFW